MILEPRARVELATCRLRIGCSTTELPRLGFFDCSMAPSSVWRAFRYCNLRPVEREQVQRWYEELVGFC